MTLRDEKSTATKRTTVNIPANVSHSLRNTSDAPLRLLCMVSPSGLEKHFAEFGDDVASRTSPAPDLSEDEQKERMAKANALAPKYGIENL